VAAGTGTKVFLAKEWSVVAEFKDHSDKVGGGEDEEEEGKRKACAFFWFFGHICI
jgi:hypothetical protein